MVGGKQRTFGDSNWSSSHMFSSLGGGGGYGGDPNINISSISIWDSELTKAELQSYRFSDLTGNENNISSYWNFNEGSGSLVADLVSGNNGTVNGATWSENVPVLGCTYQYADNYNANANVNADCEFEQNSNSILYTVNPGGNTLTDYELLFELPAQDEMTNDYSDILFVDSFNKLMTCFKHLVSSSPQSIENIFLGRVTSLPVSLPFEFNTAIFITSVLLRKNFYDLAHNL